MSNCRNVGLEPLTNGLAAIPGARRAEVDVLRRKAWLLLAGLGVLIVACGVAIRSHCSGRRGQS